MEVSISTACTDHNQYPFKIWIILMHTGAFKLWENYMKKDKGISKPLILKKFVQGKDSLWVFWKMLKVKTCKDWQTLQDFTVSTCNVIIK